jgi:hypothetical protein
MKVYIVSFTDYDEHGNYGVFSTEELAKNYIQKLKTEFLTEHPKYDIGKHMGDCLGIEVFTVDNPNKLSN